MTIDMSALPVAVPVMMGAQCQQGLARDVTAMRNGKPNMVPIRSFVAEFTARCAADFDGAAVVANMVYVWGTMCQLREEASPAGLAPTLPFSHGCSGMKLVDQRKLFSLFDAPRLGVTLAWECLIQPIKSISGLAGLGLTENIVAFASPCDRCELHNCNMRRQEK